MKAHTCDLMVIDDCPNALNNILVHLGIIFIRIPLIFSTQSSIFIVDGYFYDIKIMCNLIM